MLAKYISELLYHYECVIIPDFGGIIAKTIPARIDEKSQTLYPPSKRLGFNSQLTETDGLLANHIAYMDNISYESAVNFIKYEVEGWLEKLQNQDIILDNIGVFSLNAEGKTLFEPSLKANFLMESFGLSDIVTSSITEGKTDKETVSSGSVSPTDKKREKKTLSPFLKVAATIALLVGITYIFTKREMLNRHIQEATFEINRMLPALNIKTEKQLPEEKTEETTTTNAVQDKDTTTTPSESKITEESSHTPQSADNSTTPVIVTDKYHIIAGAFGKPANAEKKVRQLKAKGFDAKIVGINKKQMTQVAYASYATREEALVALQKIRETEIREAWLLVK